MRRLLWFRRDLRTADNPLLSLGGEVLPIFIFDTNILDTLSRDDRRVGMIHAMVANLGEALRAIGLDLSVFHGDPVKIIGNLHDTYAFDEVCASGDFDAYALERDRNVSHLLPFNKLHDTYITRPEEMLKDNATPYLVFSPFYKALQKRFTPEHLQEYTPVRQTRIAHHAPLMPLRALGFEGKSHLFASPDTLLAHFANRLNGYQTDRDRLDTTGTSSLSVALRFGTLSVRAVLRWLVERKKEGLDTEPFFRQLVFRDFYAHMLFHYPDLAWKNFRYQWRGIENNANHQAFCEGRTGFPVVDAGVRELVQTGAMHNRVRMICASFYTKDLLLPWQWGERFFGAHLNDYDVSANVLGWQWSAGTGIDPQPYFRIFNPWLQSLKYDPDAIYIKQWCPELKRVASKRLHEGAWMAEHALENYPKPMLDHKEAAASAHAFFKTAHGGSYA